MKNKKLIADLSLLTVKEAAQHARVSRPAIDLAIHTGEMRVVKIGSARRIRIVELEKWLDRKTVKEIKRC
jgi:excisionase family DNA binding protein